MTPVDVSLGQSHRTLRTVSCGKRQAAGGRRQAAGGRRIDLCLGELCTRGILICAHAVGLWPALRGGGPDRTGRLFAALIRRVRSMDESPHGPFPCPRSLRRDSEELSGAYAPPPRSGDIVACVSASGNAANNKPSRSHARVIGVWVLIRAQTQIAYSPARRGCFQAPGPIVRI